MTLTSFDKSQLNALRGALATSLTKKPSSSTDSLKEALGVPEDSVTSFVNFPSYLVDGSLKRTENDRKRTIANAANKG